MPVGLPRIEWEVAHTGSAEHCIEQAAAVEVDIQGGSAETSKFVGLFVEEVARV